MTTHRPQPADLLHLMPSDRAGLARLAMCIAMTAAGLALSARTETVVWLVGQILFGFAQVQWFVVLHEAGHGTMFRSKWIHAPVGHLASFFAGIPFLNWKRIHGKHHKWTGYQDLDPTTQSLVPRPLGLLERTLANICWRFSIPIFSVLYRINNYWLLPRLAGFFPPAVMRSLWLNTAALLGIYGATLALLGPSRLLHFAGVAVLVSLLIEDPLLLSQHTHVPQRLSKGAEVEPFTALEQEVYTRSLRFPGWLSTLLLNFDAHELHHMYPFVAGYNLRRVPYNPLNEVDWWRWLTGAKRLRGEVFLFQNRIQTGFNL